jgi:hypothetical protein
MVTVGSTSGDSVSPADNVIEHGTTEWFYRRCKGENGVACEPCQKANYAATLHKQVNLLGTPIPKHLRHGRYVHDFYGCRCDVCVADVKAQNNKRARESRARRKEAG